MADIKEIGAANHDCQCEGLRQTWPWKGYRCGNRGKYEYKGKLYCAAHFAIVSKHPCPDDGLKGKE